jgi:hypothetical protein
MAYGKSINFGNFQPGFRLLDGTWLTRAFIKVLEGGISRKFGIVAKAGGGKASATPLVNSLSRIDTVAVANDSALMPKAIAGSIAMVTNNTANSANLFGLGTDTINGAPTANATAIAAGKTQIYVCHETGKWFGGALA